MTLTTLEDPRRAVLAAAAEDTPRTPPRIPCPSRPKKAKLDAPDPAQRPRSA